MPTVNKAISGNVYKRNAATIFNGGTVGSNTVNGVTVTNSVSVKASLPINSSRYGILQDTGATSKALSAGAFAGQEKGQYIIMTYMRKLAGTANTKFNIPSADFGRRSVNLRTTTRSFLMRTAGWNYATGAFLSTPTSQTDNFGTDNEASTLSRAVPGHLLIQKHSAAKSGSLAVPYYVQYSAKTG